MIVARRLGLMLCLLAVLPLALTASHSGLVSFSVPDERLGVVDLLKIKAQVEPIDTLTDARPRVALVLSGGGGRGLAHIGVIEVLEEYGIPVDMILGTSMGSLIGGLYAAGYSPGDIRRLIESNDMPSLFVVSPLEPRPVIPAPFELPADNIFSIGFDGSGIGGAPGLIGDQRILALLNTALANVSPILDFDDLPIPFRCIGTDALTGEELVFTGGSLVSAIRSSISIPVAFAPYPVGEGRFAMDGGIVNNMPVALARALGADIVIAVDVNATQTVSIEQLNTFSGAVTQTLNIVTQRNTEIQYSLCDILLRPELSKVSTFDFFNSDSIIAAGRAECEAHEAEFEMVAARVAQSRPLQFIDSDAPGPYHDFKDSLIVAVDRLDISDNLEDIEPIDLSSFESFIGRRTDEQCLSNLAAALSKLRTQYRFSSVSFELQPLETGDDESVRVRLLVLTRSFQEQASRLYVGLAGSSSLTFGVSQAFAMRIQPTVELGVHFADLTEYRLNVDAVARLTNNAVDVSTSLEYPVLTKSPSNLLVGAGIGISFGDLSVVNHRSNPNPISSWDFRADLDFSLDYDFHTYGKTELGGVFSLVTIGAMNVPSNVSGSIDPQWDGTFFVLPMVRIGAVWANLGSGIFPESGIRADLLGHIGYDSRGSLVYNVHGAVKHVMELSSVDHIWYDAAVGISRGPSELTSSYFEYGTWNGMLGYGTSILRRDILLAGFGWQHTFNVMVFPLHLQVLARIGAKDAYEPFAPLSDASDIPSGPAPLYAPFSNLDGFDAGFGVGFGVTTPIGDILFGVGVNMTGGVSLCVEMR